MHKDSAPLPDEPDIDKLIPVLEQFNQSHLLAHWARLDEAARQSLYRQIRALDLPLIARLAGQVGQRDRSVRAFEMLEPPEVSPPYDPTDEACVETANAGESAIADGRLGYVLVAGGQGTRLGLDAPKGTYPIGPNTGRSLFAYFADRIRAVDERFGVEPPWYIMVSEHNHAATERFFSEHDHFGIDKSRIRFFQQATMPSVDESGEILLERPGQIAVSPNGHGGIIPACVESGVLDDAAERGVDILHYFQVDNWAVRLFDPYFLGLHLNADSEFSAKACRKEDPEESAGVFCLADGRVRVIEYTELDAYPELLDTDSDGKPVFFAANVAIHLVNTSFMRRVYDNFDRFPWHTSHKKIPHVGPHGRRVEPASPNGYKFETFIFDALEYLNTPPVVLEIPRDGEFTPIKEPEGAASPGAARESMNRYWGEWLKAANIPFPPEADIEINPRFAMSREDFVARAQGNDWSFDGPVSIGPKGEAGWMIA